MVKKRILYLLHNAQGRRATAQMRDFDRPLTMKGRQQLKKLKHHLSRFPIEPDLVFCSKARRARETYDELMPFCHEAHAVFPDFLYLASEYTLLELLNLVDDTIEQIMIVGHGPALLKFIQLLVPNSVEIQCKMPTGCPPASLVRLSLPFHYGWQGFNLKQAQLEEIFIPDA